MRLIADARLWWRMWSVRLATIPALIAGYLTAYPGELPKLVAYVPEDWRPLAGVLVSFVVFGVPTLVRLMQQGGGSDANG